MPPLAGACHVPAHHYDVENPVYTPQRIPQYRGNPFIEALPPIVGDRRDIAALLEPSRSSSSKRVWSTARKSKTSPGQWPRPAFRGLQRSVKD
jgi:hypothetical protein